MALKLAAAMVATVAVGHVGAIVVPGRKNAGFLATGNSNPNCPQYNCKVCDGPKGQCTSCYDDVAPFLNAKGECKKKCICNRQPGDFDYSSFPHRTTAAVGDECGKHGEEHCVCDPGYHEITGGHQAGTCKANQCTCPNGTGQTECKTDGQHQCDKCNDGFHHSDWDASGKRSVDSTCEACGTGCAECDSPAKCDSCHEGYSLQSGLCVTCQQKFGEGCSQCKRAGCTNCGDFHARISDGTCQECSVRFEPKGGKACEKCKRETCSSYKAV